MPSKDEYEAAYRRMREGKGTPADLALAIRMRDYAGGEGTREGREAISAIKAYERTKR